ncbi:MAG: hypothetical protein JWO30_3092 [Fibrobacteres bacterium]|nr:hypothetical protein [Fibrobacterota bacterium]
MRLQGWVTALLLAGTTAANGQGTLIQGRVLERAGLKPVPGASVRLLGRAGFSAVTDAKGEFKITSASSTLQKTVPAFPDLSGRARLSEGFLWLDPAGSRDAAGRKAALADPRSQGFRDPTASKANAKLAAPAAAPGPLEAACAGLVTRQVPVAADTANLGDIILEYPPRKFDLGVKPIYGAITLFDGSRASMDAEWQMWMGTYRIKNGLGPTPIEWQYLPDPVDSGMTMRTCCRTQWGDADLVTKRKFKDFQLHVEFNPVAPTGAGPANSGVYLQSYYEIQIKDDYGLTPLGNHDAGGILNETAAPENLCRPKGQWQAYDITYRAARFKNGARSEKARLTMYWNGKLVHKDKETANEHSYGVSSDSLVDEPKGLKLQSEGHDVRFRNVWLKELDLTAPSTDLGY